MLLLLFKFLHGNIPKEFLGRLAEFLIPFFLQSPPQKNENGFGLSVFFYYSSLTSLSTAGRLLRRGGEGGGGEEGRRGAPVLPHIILTYIDTIHYCTGRANWESKPNPHFIVVVVCCFWGGGGWVGGWVGVLFKKKKKKKYYYLRIGKDKRLIPTTKEN